MAGRSTRSLGIKTSKEETVPQDLPEGQYCAEHVVLAGSAFLDTDLEGAKFHDVNLRRSEFVDVALTGASFRDVCFGDVSINDANYTGMRIEGVLVTELLRVYREKS
jgi:uncharacterized protein YjbI with pentapeptide repeats